MGAVRVALTCLMASLPGPPGITFEASHFQLLPVNVCNIKPGRDLSFFLYTHSSQADGQELRLDDDALLHASTFNRSNPTVIYIHGFLEDSQAATVVLTRDSFLKLGNHNFIALDYRRLAAGPWYLTAVNNSGPIGRYIALFIDYLVSRGMGLESLHVIGHSLGGQIAGVAGRSVTSGRVPRITGLDPAGPIFNHLPPDRQLDKDSAEFVDVIHTDRTLNGVSRSVGHADFYPNGGQSPQPGCEITAVIARGGGVLELAFCSHWRSVMFFAESVNNQISFPATSCGSWQTYQDGDCPYQPGVHMGLAATKRNQGNFYLKTKKESPYTE